MNRTVELAALTSAVAEDLDEPLSVVVTVVTGTAGVGKTSLALHWAHSVRQNFPDGQLYVNLRGYDPGSPATADQVLDRFLRDLGVPAPAIPAGLEDRAALYRSLITSRRLLIILDNAATTEQVRPLLPGTRTCLVVVTSRNRLSGLVARDGALVLDVDVLPEDDAIALLGNVTARYRSHDQRDELAELARLCARLPLALRIAAERAASRPMMQLEELIADLRDESGLWVALNSEGADDADAVRTVFAWSYRALPETAARLFRLLGLHPGSEFGLPAATALAGTDTARVRRDLDILIGAHLLDQPAPARYRFHDLLRAYALDQVRHLETADIQRETLRRVLQWYLHSADAAQGRIAPFDRLELSEQASADVVPVEFDTYEQALHWYQAESNNLVGATQAAAGAGLHAVAWRLAAVLRGIYMHQNAFDDWFTTSRIGVDSATRDGDRNGQAEALESLGKAYFQSGRLAEAEGSHREALAIRQEVGNRCSEAVSLNALGLIDLRRRRFTEARSYFDSSRLIFHALGERRWEALMQSNLAEALCELKQPQPAIDLLTEALAVFREISDRFGEGNALFLLSWARRELGTTTLARSAIEQAMSIADDEENRVWQAHWLAELGKVQIAEGEPAEALISYQRAASLQRQLGDRNREAQAIEGTGQAYEHLGRPDEAQDFYRLAAAGYRELSDSWSLARSLTRLADAIDRDAEQAPQARSLRAEALSLFAEFDDPQSAAWRERITARLDR